ncbi:YkgJ family cysteine cluster protein [Saccharibacillus sp. CPCC 101409]|uniref:YkgJ family cysteine cluster protein n=1 Tax=Saccharibacillus sp. CPCC 101409 TaxID=3058041 RepID=UPI002673EEFD|nr:YkgJ family cysteine cluster protein [Saccharibacillus sp. CPCC 101409]MDO3409919.1 YkgJ family cysteine cluster protein [Saccharibacillus sp. CPCC 101409]
MPDTPAAADRKPLSEELCFCGSGRKLKHCHKSASADSRAVHVHNLYREVDGAIEEYRSHSPKQPPCREGCSACCSDYFPVSQVEFELLLVYMERHWSQGEIREAFERAEEDLEILRRENPPLHDSLTHGADRGGELDALRRHAGRNGFPCPLLDPGTGRCRVYAARPFICRTHGSSHTFYGTWRERLQPERICEYIDGGRAHRKITPNVADFWPRYDELTDVRVGAKRRPLRQYPIFYWLVLYGRHGSGHTARLGSRDNFDLPLAEHNARMAAHESARAK